MTDLHLDMQAAITLANRTLPHADRIDRLCVSCDTPLAADWCPNCEQVSETYRWPAGEPAFYEPGYNPERIEALLAQETAGLVPGEPERPLMSGGSADAGADHAPTPASRDGSGTVERIAGQSCERRAA